MADQTCKLMSHCRPWHIFVWQRLRWAGFARSEILQGRYAGLKLQKGKSERSKSIWSFCQRFTFASMSAAKPVAGPQEDDVLPSELFQMMHHKAS